MKARVDQILDGVREYLTTHEYVETPILTAYVNVDTTDPDNQRAEPAWIIDLKNEAKQLREGMDPDLFKRRNVQEQLAHAEEMILEHFRDRPSGRSVVLFSDLEDFVAIDLPVSLPTRLYFGQPEIKPLLFALDQHQSYLAALLSGDEARLVGVFLSRATEDVTVDTGAGEQATPQPQVDGCRPGPARAGIRAPLRERDRIGNHLLFPGEPGP